MYKPFSTIKQGKTQREQDTKNKFAKESLQLLKERSIERNPEREIRPQRARKRKSKGANKIYKKKYK